MKTHKILFHILPLCLACVPSYKKQKRKRLQSDFTQLSSTEPNQVSSKNSSNKHATIYPINNQTFNFLVRKDLIWDAAINILMQNYNVTILDQANGVITTEWDSFYLDGNVFRNKISLRIVSKAYSTSQLTIVNNVEILKEGPSPGTTSLNATWLPSKDSSSEAARIIRSLALALRQPPPLLPPEMKIARDTKTFR